MGARPSSFKAADVEMPAPAAVLAPPIAWTPEQSAIFDWFQSGTGHLVVRARAGTGKTTTICEAVRRAPEPNIFVTSFGNRIVKELDSRLNEIPAVLVKSLHGVGLQGIVRVWARGKRINIDARERQRFLTDAVCPANIVKSARYTISSLHTAAREHAPYITTVEEMLAFTRKYGIEHESVDQELLATLALKAMQKALEPSLLLDYADMIYLPLRIPAMSRARFDLIVVDEMQDMNEPQLDLAMMLLKPGGRFVGVGDDRQAIYLFRGADTGALDRIKDELDAEELGLTMTWRCGVEIVKHAQLLVHDIHCRPGAEKGVVGTMDERHLLDALEPADFVLSRTNAPLARVAMSLLRQNRRVVIQGKDIGKTLADTATRLSKWGDISDVYLWLDQVEKWREDEVRKALRDENEPRAEYVQDMAETLGVLAEGAWQVRDVIQRIHQLFADIEGATPFIVCSTVHKAKGLEAKNVYLLSWTFQVRPTCVCGHRHYPDKPCGSCNCEEFEVDEASLQEERNIRYVAITRAKSQLMWVNRERQ